MDKLMATRKDLLLGVWLNDAKNGEPTSRKKDFTKRMRATSSHYGEARMLFWHEYAYRYWSGLFSGFYKKRWEMFIDDAGAHPENRNRVQPESIR